MSGDYRWLQEVCRCEVCGNAVPEEELNGQGVCIDCETTKMYEREAEPMEVA